MLLLGISRGLCSSHIRNIAGRRRENCIRHTVHRVRMARGYCMAVFACNLRCKADREGTGYVGMACGDVVVVCVQCKEGAK